MITNVLPRFYESQWIYMILTVSQKTTLTLHTITSTHIKRFS